MNDREPSAILPARDEASRAKLGPATDDLTPVDPAVAASAAIRPEPPVAAPGARPLGPRSPRSDRRTPDNEGMEYTVVLVEHDYPFISAVKLALEHQPRFKYLGCEWERAKVDQLIEEQAPDIVIVDLGLLAPSQPRTLGPMAEDPEEGLQAIERIQTLSPQTLIIACSSFFVHEPGLAQRALERGADALLTKQFTPTDGEAWGDWLRSQLITTLQGQFIPSAIVAQLLERAELDRTAHSRGPGLDYSLSLRERQVLHLLARGRNAKEIANELNIEYATVRSHIRNLVKRLHARNREDAIRRARDLGALDDEPPR